MSRVGCAAALLTCSCVNPFYNSDIGVEGVPTDEGALAGTFGMVAQLSDEAETPLGKQTGGGQTYFLVKRSYEGGDEYSATLEVCRTVNFEVGGLSSEVSSDTRDAVPKFAGTWRVDHPSGEMTTKTLREVWAIDDLDADDDIPDHADDGRIIDMEDDGNPGATLQTHGLVDGELYFVQRKNVSIEGVVTGEDEILGLTTHQKEVFVIDATHELLRDPPERAQHPDPKESWSHEVRLKDSADCGDVRKANDDGKLSHLRPFD